MSERDVSAEDGVPAGREWQEELHRSFLSSISSCPGGSRGKKTHHHPQWNVDLGASAGQPNDASVLIYLDFRKREADNRP